MALSKQEKWERCLARARRIRACVNGLSAEDLLDEETINDFSGIIAEWIHRCPVEWSGLISKAKLEEIKSGYAYATYDHWHGRKTSGELVFEQVVKGASLNRIAYILRSRSRVHKVTKTENNELKAHDTKIKFKGPGHARKEYTSAKIELINPDEILIYNICGIDYSKKSAKIEFNIDQIELNKRINSKTKKWSEWRKKENQ